MSDIFQEVEEEVRRERLEQLWKQYGDYVMAAAALVIIAVAGLELWRVYDQRQRIKASDAYNTALRMEQSGQSAVASEMFGRIAKNAPSGYAALARLQHADAMLVSGNRADAIAAYKQIAAGSDPILSALARLHAAWALVDQTSKPEIETLLGPLPGEKAWAPLAREVLAYASYRAGNASDAIRTYDAIAADKDAPDGVRQRAQVTAQFLKAGGQANFGTVPPPKQAQTPGAAPAGAGGPPSR